MRIVVFLFIAGVAAFMGFIALRGECPGGAIVMSASQCRAASAMSAEACATVFRDADRITRAAATVFTDEQRCLAGYDACTRSSVVQGFTPVPAGFCVVVTGSTITRQEPIYRRVNAPRIGGNS